MWTDWVVGCEWVFWLDTGILDPSEEKSGRREAYD